MNFQNRLAQELEKNLNEKRYHTAVALLDENQYAEEVKFKSNEVIAVTTQFLTEQNFKNSPELFSICEVLLKKIAAKGNKEDVLFELLETIETTKHDEVLTSLLKAMQVILLRIDHSKSHAIVWVLDSISSYIKDIELFEKIPSGVGKKAEELLENDPEIKRLLSLYFTLFLFIEPIQRNLLETKFDHIKPFRYNGFNGENVIITFLLQMMGSTFAVLKFDKEKNGKSKTYSRQCAEKLVELFSKLYKDPFNLLIVVEQRILYTNNEVQSFDTMTGNIFLIKERTSDLSFGILFYLIFVEKLMINEAPKIYQPKFLIDKTMLLVLSLLKQNEPYLQYKGVKLGKSLLEQVSSASLNMDDISVNTIKSFMADLSTVIIYSPDHRNRKEGVELLSLLIESHSLNAQYFLIDCLFNICQNDGLLGYTIMIYKKIMARLFNQNLFMVKSYFNQKRFKNTVMNHICILKDQQTVDLMDNKEKLLSALNFLIFLLQRDKKNYTSIWDFVTTIEQRFNRPLREALDLSRAHYKNEYKNVQEEKCGKLNKTVENLQICIQNSTEDHNALFSKEKRYDIIAYALNTFDIMEGLLVRVNECITNKNKNNN